jgi:hypothetical protein
MLALAVAAVAGGLFVGAPGAAAAPRPALRIADDVPMTLRGSGFRPREPVRVVVHMGPKRLTRSLRAQAAGTFTVRFAGLRLDYCAIPLTLRAHGTQSGLARARIPRRQCAAP